MYEPIIKIDSSFNESRTAAQFTDQSAPVNDDSEEQVTAVQSFY